MGHPILDTASRRTSGERCAYRIVISMVLCTSNSCTVLRLLVADLRDALIAEV